MEEKHIKAGVVIYSVIIDRLCKDGHHSEAQNLFSEMQEKGIAPDVFTYNCMIDGCCSFGRWSDAEQLLRDMVKREIIIDGLCKGNKVDQAWDLFSSLPLDGVQTYNIMIAGFCVKRAVSRANALFRKFRESGHAPDGYTYNTLIKGRLRAGEVAASAELIKDMRSSGFCADESTVKMVDDMISKGRLDKSFSGMLS